MFTCAVTVLNLAYLLKIQLLSWEPKLISAQFCVRFQCRIAYFFQLYINNFHMKRTPSLDFTFNKIIVQLPVIKTSFSTITYY